MNFPALNSAVAAGSAARAAELRADLQAGREARAGAGSQPKPDAAAKAAGQFEAIILRQLLAPAIEPMMAGGIGGAKSPGGGVYGYMLTDVLAGSISEGGGLGLAKMLQAQFTSRGQAATGPAATATTAEPADPSTSASKETTL